MNNELIMSYIERIENVNEQIDNLRADRKEILKEAQSNGFILKALNHVIKERKRSREERAEERTIFETYENAIGLE